MFRLFFDQTNNPFDKTDNRNSDNRFLNLVDTINHEKFGGKDTYENKKAEIFQQSEFTYDLDSVIPKRNPDIYSINEETITEKHYNHAPTRTEGSVSGINCNLFDQIITVSSHIPTIVEENANNTKMSIPLEFNGYTYIKKLNSGSFGIVGLVSNQHTGKLYASKFQLPKDSHNQDLTNDIKHELSTLLLVNGHPNIIKIYDNFIIRTTSGNSLYVIITEYCQYGNLHEYSSNHYIINQKMQYQIFFQVLQAIKFIHDKGMSHGDIKSQNILIDENHSVKICDFGFSKHISDNTMGYKKGTKNYAAPELFYPEAYDILSADVWAIGITFYEIRYHKFPFSDHNYVPPQFNQDDKFQYFFRMCTNTNPDLRAKINELIENDIFSII